MIACLLLALKRANACELPTCTLLTVASAPLLSVLRDTCMSVGAGRRAWCVRFWFWVLQWVEH